VQDLLVLRPDFAAAARQEYSKRLNRFSGMIQERAGSAILGKPGT
jgi:hypothetical protein